MTKLFFCANFKESRFLLHVLKLYSFLTSTLMIFYGNAVTCVNNVSHNGEYTSYSSLWRSLDIETTSRRYVYLSPNVSIWTRVIHYILSSCLRTEYMQLTQSLLNRGARLGSMRTKGPDSPGSTQLLSSSKLYLRFQLPFRTWHQNDMEPIRSTLYSRASSKL